MKKEVAEKMTKPQYEAVTHKDGPMLVLAGPGSGKTFVLTLRIQELIEEGHVNPGNILVVTFTRAAADQMKERFLKLSSQETTAVSFGTFHSIFFKIIRYAYHYQGSQIIREEQKYALLREIIRSKKVAIEDEKEFISGLISEISLVKGEMMNLEHYYSTSCPSEVFCEIFQAYQGWMDQNHMIDFDDMQVICYELFKGRPDILASWQRKFQYILVDEFQDISRIQYELVKMLSAPLNNLFIVGDDDQSIYRFRGARPEIMLGFEKDYPNCKKVLLDVNFRCDRNIVAAAGRVISKNKTRFEKEIQANRPAACAVLVRKFEDSSKQYLHVIREIQEAEKQGTPLEEMAVLFRTTRCAGGLVQKLMDFNIPFQMKDVLPDLYSHFISRNILAYVRIAMGSRDRSDFLEIINRPNRYVSRTLFDTPQVSFDALANVFLKQDKEWMADRIYKLEVQVKMISKMTPYAAISYIRNAIGYEEYLQEYAAFRRMKPSELFDILDEIQENSREFKTFDEWLLHIETYQQELKEKAADRNRKGEGVVLSTMHAAKGLEYDTVYIIDANEGITPHEKAVLEEDIEEERRLFYVAMTRAKNRLLICCTKEKFNKAQEPSMFIREFLGSKKKKQQERN
ncbi:MAG: ATP-dependent helicase [Lachnospiraceae bacterium]|nr:ATP-dependent helicase [Lachnospiraceae bacterium]